MPKFLMIATSAAQPGRDGDYNAWYDSTHMAQICAIPGVIGGRRLVAEPSSPFPAPSPYLAIYEVETDDPAGVIAELTRRGQAGEITPSDTLDRSSAQLWLYRML